MTRVEHLTAINNLYGFLTSVVDQMKSSVVNVSGISAPSSSDVAPEVSPTGNGDSSSSGRTRRDVSVETSSVGITTDPDCLGPCEPGTSVVLEGIVWSESNNGQLLKL